MNPNKKAEELIEKFGELAVDVVDVQISTFEELIDSGEFFGTDREFIEYKTSNWQQVKELIINKK